MKTDFLIIGSGIAGLNLALKLSKIGKVVIEEKLEGQEFSAMFFTDGNVVRSMPIVQDNKRAFVDDKGPNTGGMGTVSDANHSLPFLQESDLEEASKITEKVMHALKEECGENFHGIMYGGFIATARGVRLIEYNARFGDPDAMNVLPILESDFVEICEGIINENLAEKEIIFARKATVCKYVVPEGYPDNPVKNEEIFVDYEKIPKGVEINFASVSEESGKLILKGSRAISMTGIADTIQEAEKLAEEAVKAVLGPVFHRQDIGTQKLLGKRIKHMESLRN
jgi:phosphoribosylamine--glycine ligase